MVDPGFMLASLAISSVIILVFIANQKEYLCSEVRRFLGKASKMQFDGEEKQDDPLKG